jgi:hypothetical protein
MNSTTSIPQRNTGPLTAEGAERGIVAVRENAARLARDAKILFQARRYSSAALLATMALVEFSRISALLALPTAREEKEIRRSWNRFHDGIPNFPWSLCHGGRPAISDAETNQMLALIGAIGERVDYVGAGVWTEPAKLIGRPLAQALVDMAEQLCARPLDSGPLRVWMEVVDSSPEDADDDEIFERFRHALRSRGFAEVAALVPAVSGTSPGSQVTAMDGTARRPI